MQSCYHCGGKCETEIPHNNQIFCCDGCVTVYDILNESNLSDYYKIESNPGIKSGKNYKGKFDFLKLPEFKNKLILFSDNQIIRIKFFLPQIHCSSCLWLLERLPKLNAGVLQSQINFVKKEAEITFDETKISLIELAELLATIGYPPLIQDEQQKKSKFTDKRLILQIGVSGFCFGNIMLLSFPEYLGIDESYSNFQTVFNYLNLVLSIPVLLFGAKDYLISAYKALRSKFINIDVPISLGIVAFYFQSVYEIISQTGAGYFDSFAGLIFFLLIGKWFQQTTYGTINFERDYKSYFPIAVSKLNDKNETIIPLSEVKVGDKLVIRNNELIPADAILLNGSGQIDYSFVTGESALIAKQVGEQLFAGGRHEGSTIEVEVIKEVQNSYLTGLWNNPIFDKEKVDTSFTEIITKYFTIAIILIGFGGFIAWQFFKPELSIFVLVSVLIIACPCAIALSVPFTYGNGIRILSKKHFYLRSAKVIEAATDITDIVFDKTGTITHSNASEITWEGEPLTESELNLIRTIVSNSSHPLNRQLTNKLSQHATKIEIEDLTELTGQGIRAKLNQLQIQMGSATWLNVAPKTGTRIYVKINDQLKGSFLFKNFYREGIQKLIDDLKVKYQLHVLSGDNDAELVQLKKMFPDGTSYNFNQKPNDKLVYIEQLQKQGKKVMMLGDGLNDAGALRQSNFGISVVDDVYSFSPSSDAILNGDKLNNLNKFIKYCKQNKNTVKLSYVFSLSYNVVGLTFAVTGNLTPLVAAVLMPISSISVVLFATIMTNISGRKL